jgi:general secretion pathway protein G
MATRPNHARVFFPWERRRGLVGWALRARGRITLSVIAVLVLLVVVVRRERQSAAVRATRAAITDATRAVAAYRAANGGKCPASIEEVARGGYLLDLPVDGWSHSLRLVCPGRKDPKGFDVVSDGPDGEPFGLDRIE